MLDDKYRLDELLEVGGMGAVYLGTHTKLQKQVAIKVLRRELASSPDMIERFQREAVAASRIGHENIVDVSDIGTAPDGSPFIVMEYLTGATLAEKIRGTGPQPVGLACAIIREVLAAISAAHRAGIIHRDLKPENIFIVLGSRGESVKILDFGISRVIEARAGSISDARLTATGQVMGTPYYMAPEQAAGHSDLTGAIDVYATGVILYEMLSGAVPFEAGNYNTIIFKVLSGEYQPLSERMAPMPSGLDHVVHRAMALKPEERFASADEFAAALAPYSADAMSASQALPLGQAFADRSVGFAPTMTPSDISRLPSAVIGDTRFGAAAEAMAQPTPKRGRTGKFAMIGALCVLIGGGVAAVAISEIGSESEVTAPARATAAPDAAPELAVTVDAGKERVPVPEPQEVTLTFEVTPKNASVRVDGKRVRDGTVTVPRDERELKVVVKRRGYETKTRTIRADQSRAVEVLLEKKRASAGGKKDGKRIIGDSPYD